MIKYAAPFILAAVFALTGCAQGEPKMHAADPPRFDAPECGTSPGVAKDPPAADMALDSEAIPAGAQYPDGSPFGWALRPTIRANAPRPGWTSMVPWGQVYPSVEGNGRGGDAPNTRVEVRNLRLFVKSKATNLWCKVATIPAPTGAFYWADFRDDSHLEGDQRIEPNGGVSFRAIPQRCFHFYSQDAYPIPPEGAAAVYADFEARLIQDDPTRPDDRPRATFVADAGVDYWISATAAAGQFGINNEDAGMGRFKRITSAWRTFGMSTAAAIART